MNRPTTPDRLIPTPDVQASRDERHLAIDRVGIKGLRYPLTFADGEGERHRTAATCAVYVALPEEQKGTHMSRLVSLLEARATPGAAPLSVAGLRGFVEEVGARRGLARVRRGVGRRARRAGRPARNRVSVLRAQDRAGFRRCQPAGLRRAP